MASLRVPLPWREGLVLAVPSPPGILWFQCRMASSSSPTLPCCGPHFLFHSVYCIILYKSGALDMTGGRGIILQGFLREREGTNNRFRWRSPFLTVCKKSPILAGISLRGASKRRSRRPATPFPPSLSPTSSPNSWRRSPRNFHPLPRSRSWNKGRPTSFNPPFHQEMGRDLPKVLPTGNTFREGRSRSLPCRSTDR